MSNCTCNYVDPKYWTTHYGAVEPGSMIEPDYDCPEHFPDSALEDIFATVVTGGAVGAGGAGVAHEGADGVRGAQEGRDAL